ncbi:unnamed protein product [Angiostrongylus costaricensis]|uniref:Uncharacterized protein n=1 Tax=Angiostrongylus costaricensis TaxID=334426 RepID=A0A0R3PTP3_ANGCS|nr:unnamed protein product [Angiostrongylus costaricensis]
MVHACCSSRRCVFAFVSSQIFLSEPSSRISIREDPPEVLSFVRISAPLWFNLDKLKSEAIHNLMRKYFENRDSRRWLTEEDLARHEGEDATSRRTTSMDHRLGSPALRKTKTSKR